MNQNAGTFVLHSEINIYSSYLKTSLIKGFVLLIFSYLVLSQWMNFILYSGIVYETLHFIYLNCCYIAITNDSTQRHWSEEKINK